MSKILENKMFKRKVLFGVGLFMIVQLISYIFYLKTLAENEETARSLAAERIYIDFINMFGFPFPIFYGSSFRSMDQFNFVAMTVNLIISIVFIFILCFLVKFIHSKFSAWSNKLK